MHNRSALSLALLCCTAVAQPPATNPDLTPPTPDSTTPLTVVVRIEAPTPSRVLIAMEKEVDSLVARSSIRTNWVMSTDPPRVFDQIAVVTLHGACRPNAPLPLMLMLEKGDSKALGQTQVVDGQVLPFADVHCDPVRKLIAHQLASKPKSEREDLLGRALGRVMAHELYHILLKTTIHGRNGLAREAQTSADLMADRDNFAPADERRLSQVGAVADDGGDSPDGLR